MLFRQILIITITCLLSFAIKPDIYGQVMGIELLEGKEKMDISFDYSSGFILVKIRLNNFIPLNFILDTGAEHIILFKKEIADILDLEFEKRIPLIGSDLDSEVNAFITRNVDISIAQSKTVKRDLIVLEENFLDLESLVGQSIDGILGSRFFRGLVLKIDYKKHKISLIDFNKFNPAKYKDYQVIDMAVTNYKPYISSSITTSTGENVPVKLLLDTGSALPFLIFIDTHPSLQLPSQFIKGNLGRGLGGNLEGFLGVVRKMNLNDEIYYNNIVSRFQNIDPNLDPIIYQNRNGLIGNPILARFHVIFDFIQQKLYLKPRKKYNKKFKYDKSGLTIFAFGLELNQYYVKDVVENSPAYDADIRKGDVIKKIGLWPSKFYTLSKINKILQKRNGKKVRFIIERNGVKLKKSLILRDLLQNK